MPKHYVRTIVDAMANGDLRPLFDAMSDDVSWRWMGVTSRSRTFEGKQEVVGELFGAAADALADWFSVQLHNIVADGDHVVVEHTGRNATPDGSRGILRDEAFGVVQLPAGPWRAQPRARAFRLAPVRLSFQVTFEPRDAVNQSASCLLHSLTCVPRSAVRFSGDNFSLVPALTSLDQSPTAARCEQATGASTQDQPNAQDVPDRAA